MVCRTRLAALVLMPGLLPEGLHAQPVRLGWDGPTRLEGDGRWNDRRVKERREERQALDDSESDQRAGIGDRLHSETAARVELPT